MSGPSLSFGRACLECTLAGLDTETAADALQCQCPVILCCDPAEAVCLPGKHVNHENMQAAAEEAGIELAPARRLPNSIPISCSQQLNLDGLLSKIWDMMALVRVYTKRVGRRPDFSDPVVMSEVQLNA